MKGYGILGFIFGVGAGGAAGFYIGKTMSEKNRTAEVEFKVSQIRNYYDSKFEALKNELTKEKMAEDARAEKEMEPQEETTEDEAHNEDVAANEKIVQKCNYSAFSKKTDEEEIEGGISRMNIILEPDEIEEDEYWDYVDEGYRPTSVILCAKDGTWFDEDDISLGDMTSRIGADNTQMFCESAMDNGREEDRWVRNEMTNEVFRIYVFDMSSEEYIKRR